MIDFRDLDLAGAIGAHYNDGLEAVTRIVKLRLGAAAWAAFSPEEKQRFNRQICVHYRIYGTSRYAAERIDQLLAGNFGFWVLHHCSDTCEERFAELDGIAVPPSDPFWLTYYPPHLPGCGCSVSGARTEAGVRRLDGIPGKPIPSWCVG